MIPKTKLYHSGTATLEFYGGIGIGPDQISADEFDEALYKVRRCDCLTLLIDNRGGAIEHSNRMSKALRGAPFQREAIIVGQCDSAAVDVLMSCSNRRAVDGSTCRLHRCNSPSGAVADADARQIATTYSGRTWHCGDLRGCTEKMVEAWVNADTSLSAADMWRYGFVDRVIQPTTAIPLRIEVDISGCNRPMAGRPYVVQHECLEYDTQPPECWEYAAQPTAKAVIQSEPAQKRQPIEFPEMPKSLVGHCFHSAADFLAYRRDATGKKADDSAWQALRALETDWIHRIG